MLSSWVWSAFPAGRLDRAGSWRPAGLQRCPWPTFAGAAIKLKLITHPARYCSRASEKLSAAECCLSSPARIAPLRQPAKPAASPECAAATARAQRLRTAIPFGGDPTASSALRDAAGSGIFCR